MKLHLAAPDLDLHLASRERVCLHKFPNVSRRNGDGLKRRERRARQIMLALGGTALPPVDVDSEEMYY